MTTKSTGPVESFPDWLAQQSAAEFSGLRPPHWVVAGPGFSREEIKGEILGLGAVLCGSVVHSVESIAATITGVAPAQILGGLSRQEVLRFLLSQRSISQHFEALRELRRERTFFRKLDRALQSGRGAFVGWDEADILDARLIEQLGPNRVRRELMGFAQAYEAWLTANSVWDPVTVLRQAVFTLRERTVALPARITICAVESPEPLLAAFFDELGRQTQVTSIGRFTAAAACGVELPTARWHRLDDAAQALVDALLDLDDLSQAAVIVADDPETRRTLQSALARAGIPAQDPRDPLELRTDERIKESLLGIQVVASRFAREDVKAYLMRFAKDSARLSTELREIDERGIVRELDAYAGGKLARLHEELVLLAERFGSRRSSRDFARAHLAWLGEKSRDRLSLVEMVGFWEAFWAGVIEDFTLTGEADRAAPILFWQDRISQRLTGTAAAAKQVRMMPGLYQTRLTQGMTRRFSHVFLFGLGVDSLSARTPGDWFWTEPEREVLAADFTVATAGQRSTELRSQLLNWISQAASVRLLSADFSSDGSERAQVEELEHALGVSLKAEPLGAHPRWLGSYGASFQIQPQQVTLAPLGRRELSATHLDHYSRCAFLGLSQGRWELWDRREPTSELWPEVRGVLLHSAITDLLRAGHRGAVDVDRIRAVVDQAWQARRPKGLLRSRRIERSEREKLVSRIEVFFRGEGVYQTRAQSRVLALDDVELSLEIPDGDGDGSGDRNDNDKGPMRIVGRPDRIDELSGGIFIMDYKSSSGLPNGTKMLERSYRLQLPFYALAAQNQLKKPVVGVQFIELSAKGSRGAGVFFERFNGKGVGMPVQVRSNSGSLLKQEPDEVWARFVDALARESSAFLAGEFSPIPKFSVDCARCSSRDLCGERRKLPDTGPGPGSQDAENE